MKMVKSLLLGGAASLVAVAGAQAADLPVKAKPVEYVKVCSLYGEGFFYIPGTDTCLKIGGFIRFELGFGTQPSDIPYNSGGNGANNRISSADLQWRTRLIISDDVRTQTEYGTLRAYIRAGYSYNTGNSNTGNGSTGVLYTERSFIQFAGFTFGKAQSYFDFSASAYSLGGAVFMGGASFTATSGTNLAAYTWQFGNGVSATVGIEDGWLRRSGMWDATNVAQNVLAIAVMPGPATFQDNGTQNATAIGDYAADSVPDIVGNLRVDQAWGSAQIAGALHQLKGGSFGTNAPAAFDGVNTGTAPSDAWGFAAAAGVKLNLPSPGDAFWVEATYTRGALGYVGMTGENAQPPFSAAWNRFNGGNVAAAWGIEGIFANRNSTPGAAAITTGIDLTTGWSVIAAVEHYWTPALRTSLYGTFTAVSFDDEAQNIFCGSPQSPVRTKAGAANTAANFAAGIALPGCNPNFDLWSIGSRTIWNPVKNLDIGVEVMYSKIDTQFDPSRVSLSFAGAGGRAAGLYSPSSEGVWSSILRIQRNFYP